jgi:hypothetical protein
MTRGSVGILARKDGRGKEARAVHVAQEGAGEEEEDLPVCRPEAVDGEAGQGTEAQPGPQLGDAKERKEDDDGAVVFDGDRPEMAVVGRGVQRPPVDVDEGVPHQHDVVPPVLHLRPEIAFPRGSVFLASRSCMYQLQ